MLILRSSGPFLYYNWCTHPCVPFSNLPSAPAIWLPCYGHLRHDENVVVAFLHGSELPKLARTRPRRPAHWFCWCQTSYLESKETGFQHLLIACDVSAIDEAVADEASLSCLWVTLATWSIEIILVGTREFTSFQLSRDSKAYDAQSDWWSSYLPFIDF